MHKRVKSLKWLARILSGLALLVFFVLFAAEGLREFKNGIPLRIDSVLMLLIFTTFAWIFAWFREKEGGIAMTIAGFIFGLSFFYNRGGGNSWAFLLYSLPFIIPGILFWWIGNSDEKNIDNDKINPD